MLVAVALGAVVTGGASLASAVSTSSAPANAVTWPNQIADAAQLPAPALTLTTSAATPATTAPTSGPTTTSPTSTTSAPPTTTGAISATIAPPPVTTVVVTTTKARPQSDPTSPSQAAQVFRLVNAARADMGCDPLREDSRLDASALGHSEDMSDNDYFSHDGPGSTSFAQRIEDAGYPSPGGENIAEGQTSAQQVFNAWMSDSGHRDNILNCRFVAMGVGVDTQGWYWTQDFGY